jgi:hypothetical protein
MQRVNDDAEGHGSSAPREWTEAEYTAGERTSDHMLGLWFLVIVVGAALGALAGWATGSEAAFVVVMVACVGGFLLWASPRTKDLPPQRQTVRWRWLARVGVLYPLGALVGVGLLLALVGFLTRV